MPWARSPSISPSERDGVDHDAVADDAGFSRSQDAGGDQVQDVLLAGVDDGVPRVVPALAAHDDVRVARENINDLPLPLIAPLGAD